MSYSIFAGKQRSLVFPVMCNGFLTLDYSDNIASTGTGIPYGLWDLDNNFTFECVLTPYEINGYGFYAASGNEFPPQFTDNNPSGSAKAYVSGSKKIQNGLNSAATESNYENHKYMDKDDRGTHEMRIFHSTNLQISLINSTTHNWNNPARYKIKVGIKLGTASMEYFTTDEVIIPNLGAQYSYAADEWSGGDNDLTGFDADGKAKYRLIGKTSSIFSGSHAVNVSGGNPNDYVSEFKEIFVRDGFTFTSIGFVDSATASALTLKAAPSQAVGVNTNLYIHDKYFEPSYINNTYHIACAWDNQNKEILIFFNGRLVKTGTHTQTDSFSMAAEDFYIGANGGGTTGVSSAKTNNQFMGELHELSFMNIRKTQFSATNNLMPNYNNTVLYLRFEEVDE